MKKIVSMLKWIVIIVIIIFIAKELKLSAKESTASEEAGITATEIYFPSKEDGPTEPKVYIPEGYDFRWGSTQETGKVFCGKNHWYPVGKGHESDFVGDYKQNCTMSFLSDGEAFTVTLYVWEKKRLKRKAPTN